ncbi:ADP-ribosylglycohydrolase-domain-containing protein [Mycena crocata]|nr:ADP-ribosylglycohydrolase-domain-containing protein [Mycena crocata]
MLHAQRVVPATPATKIRLAVLATALCDALGGPAEFHPRFTFDFILHMKPNNNFGLPAGVWTDDTSMALALARSLATFEFQSPEGKPMRGGFDAADQLDAYYRWWQDGTLSATGRCFDIGNTIQHAVSLYHEVLKTAGAAGPSPRSPALRRISAALTPDSSKTMERGKWRAAAAGALGTIGHDLKGSVFGGNGSLMRVVLSKYRYVLDGEYLWVHSDRVYISGNTAILPQSRVCAFICHTRDATALTRLPQRCEVLT